MEQVLLLNITYEPLRIVNWKKALTLLCLGKVEVIEEYNRDIHAISFTAKLPAVIRLLHMVRRPNGPVKFSRQNIYARDRYKCQYCGDRFSTEDLTYDHIHPKSRGGRTAWENIVTCCIDCNRSKGGAHTRRGLHETSPQTELPQMDPSYKDYRWFQGGSGKLARLSLLEYRACRLRIPDF